LSKAQLARKRANDREAQRNIRQRTKEHIASLEKKVQELEQGGRSSSMERVMKRNRELEEEIEQLRVQVAAHQGPIAPTQAPPPIPEELLIPQKVTLDWMPAEPSHWTGDGDLNVNISISGTTAGYTPAVATSYPPASSSMAYDDEVSQQMYHPSAIPIWDDSVFGSQASQCLTKSVPAWAPFHPALYQTSRFADLQPSGFEEVISSQPAYNTTCWQSQPSIYAWQISTKLKAPTTLVDHLMFDVLESHRHLTMSAKLTSKDLVAPSFPPVHLLFDQPGPPEKKPSTLTEVMARYAAVLSRRGFQLIPEKLASFMCMYRFVQWQISPSNESYQALHYWQAPRPSQLEIPHPAWMDLPPWGEFRDKIIENQDKYDNAEFQNLYAMNLNVNFPHDPMEALIFKDGKIMVSPTLDRHWRDISNISMKKPFADRYPEFRDVCRFDEE
jgi:Domain of unknown function (DUF3425)